jgi:Mce-associated membrane protein
VSLRKNPLLALALVAVALAAVLAAWAGTSWYAAADDDAADFAASRDDALAAARQAVTNLNTLDHRELDEGLDRWEASATGELLTQLRQGRDGFEKEVRKAETVTTAEVLSAALTELDDRAGRADVLVAVRITVAAPGEKPQAKESRMLGEVTRTGDGRKLSALGQAPAGDSAGGNASEGSGDGSGQGADQGSGSDSGRAGEAGQ